MLGIECEVKSAEPYALLCAKGVESGVRTGVAGPVLDAFTSGSLAKPNGDDAGDTSSL